MCTARSASVSGRPRFLGGLKFFGWLTEPNEAEPDSKDACSLRLRRARFAEEDAGAADAMLKCCTGSLHV